MPKPKGKPNMSEEKIEVKQDVQEYAEELPAEPVKEVKPAEPEKVICDCPAKHDLTNPSVRGVITATGVKERFYLKISPKQPKRHCYNYTKSLVKRELKSVKKDEPNDNLE